ncbi:HWE histidine kinase domain-containing protein, partial [Escherichia coli]|uniref:HWE histidine kinase domain-containing protein n=3 Tax=Pseudomonadota TaxID=1224 RepID=UPI003D36848B
YDDNGTIVRWFGTCTDIHEQKEASEQREIVAHELSHRIKNIFAVISGLINLSARSNPGFGPIASDLRERVTALGRAHDFVR